MGELRTRTDALYTAEKAGDWTTYYGLMDQSLHDAVTLGQFVAQAKFEYRLVAWKVLTISRAELTDRPGDMVAKVAMDVTVKYTGKDAEKATDQTDYWVFRDGHWYWVWRGWPAD